MSLWTYRSRKLQTSILGIIFKYALILQSDSQNGVVIKTYIARLISLSAPCVFYGHAPSLLEDKYIITSARGNTENIVRLRPISSSAFGLVGHGTQKCFIFPYSTRTCVITYYIPMPTAYRTLNHAQEPRAYGR